MYFAFPKKDGVRVENERYSGCGTGKAEAIEKHIMQWAAEHPEPVYPTWKEWRDKNFSNNDAPMWPCTFETKEYLKCKNFIRCEQCINTPIPAHIAAKLGIKPIKGGNGK